MTAGECGNDGGKKIARNEEGYHLSLVEFSNRFCVINGHGVLRSRCL
jgi:hypothetical protein